VKSIYCAALAASIIAAPVSAQEAAVPAVSTSAVVAVAPAAPTPGQWVLPANTEVTVTPNDLVTSKKVRQGDTFTVSVVYDVMMNGYIVIPRGSRGQGVVTWRTGKGAFGKSAKMDVELRWLEVAGRRVAIEGKHRQEGEGNTAATVGAVVAVGPFGAFVTGKSAAIPNGMHLTAFTSEPLPVDVAGLQPAAQRAMLAPAAPTISQGTTPAAATGTSTPNP